MPTRAKSASVAARDALKRKSLTGWREQGTGVAAGKAAGVRESTIRGWHRSDPDYREAVRAAIDEYASTAGQETASALLEHVRAAVRGDMVQVESGTGLTGKPLDVRRRIELNPALARLLLTRADPRYTHPKQEVDVTADVTVQSALDEVGEALAAHDAEAVPDAMPEPETPQEGAQALSEGVSAADLDEALGE